MYSDAVRDHTIVACIMAAEAHTLQASCRSQNFTLTMEGATTAEAIAEKRAAEFEAAEAIRLKVRRDAMACDSV